jgi:hypothetical protein
MAITTAQLLDAIKRGVTVPSTQYRFTDSDLLKFADEETESVILPMLTSLRQEFLVTQQNTTTVANQAAYKIPYRAVGRTLRDLKLARSSDATFVRTLSYVSPEDTQAYTAGGSGEPVAFTVRGDKVVLLPTPVDTSYVLQMFYEIKPSALVSTDEAGLITAINTSTGVVTISSSVTDFATGDEMDFVDGESGCSVKGLDIANTNVSGTSVTFAAANLPSDLAVGDYIALANETPVVQLPDELSQVLAQCVICRLLEALGDFEGLNAAQKKLEQRKEASGQLLTPRVEGAVPVVFNANGLLRRPNISMFRYRL